MKIIKTKKWKMIMPEFDPEVELAKYTTKQKAAIITYLMENNAVSAKEHWAAFSPGFKYEMAKSVPPIAGEWEQKINLVDYPCVWVRENMINNASVYQPINKDYFVACVQYERIGEFDSVEEAKAKADTELLNRGYILPI